MMIRHGVCTISDTAKLAYTCTVWQYATICDEAVLGEHVVIGSAAWVGKRAVIGDYTRVQHGVFIPNGTVIGKSVFIGPNATLTDDKYPRAGGEYQALPPVLEDDCSIGAGAVILPGVRVGKGAMVGAGAVVCTNVPDYTIVVGCPARPSA